MWNRLRLVFAAVTIGVMLAAVQSAAGIREKTVEARPGNPTLIFTFWRCGAGGASVPYQGTAFVEHGTLTYKDVTNSRCGSPNWQTREVWYTSSPGFKGVDTVTFPWVMVITIPVH